MKTVRSINWNAINCSIKRDYNLSWDQSPIFDNCKTITIGENVETIPSLAFASCNVTKVTILNGVTSIGERAFSRCRDLTSIHFQGTIAQWNAISKGSDWNNNTGSYTVHCTDGDIAK